MCSRSPKRPSNQSVSHSSAVCVLGQRSDQSVSHSSAVCVLGLSKQSRLCSRSVKAELFVFQVCQSRAVCVLGLSKQSCLCSRSVKAELFVFQVGRTTSQSISYSQQRCLCSRSSLGVYPGQAGDSEEEVQRVRGVLDRAVQCRELPPPAVWQQSPTEEHLRVRNGPSVHTGT